MSQHRVSSSSHTTQLLYTNSYTCSHPNVNFLQYTIQILVPHVIWSAQVVRDSKIDHTQRLSRNPKRVIVQWVGIGKRTHTHTLFNKEYLSSSYAYETRNNIKIPVTQRRYFTTAGSKHGIILGSILYDSIIKS